MQGTGNVVMTNSRLYVAQNVCPVITTFIVCDMDLTFFSRLKFMNMPAGVKMIYSSFPKDPIQVPYSQVVRTFFRG